jgi:hypothetical protein
MNPALLPQGSPLCRVRGGRRARLHDKRIDRNLDDNFARVEAR